MNLKNTDIKTIKGISDKRAALFKKLGVTTVEELLTYYPRSYIDYTEPISIADCEIGETAVIRGVVEKKLKPFIGGRINVYKLVVSDGETELLCTFFNSEYSFNRLLPGKEYLFYGKVTGTVLMREISNPQFIGVQDEIKLIPKYRLTAGLSQAMIMTSLRNALDLYDEPEPLNEKYIIEYNLTDKKTALRQIHFPSSKEECNAAKRRLAFEELLTLQMGMAVLKNRNRKLTGAVMSTAGADASEEFYRTLPFTPTNAQKRSVNECIDDMRKYVPMNRLLQGDVGSGKTMAAAAVCFFAYKNNYQSAVMAPTEILAKQHYETFNKFLFPLGVKVILLTGSLTVKEKNEAKAQIESGEAGVVIGTQALIQKSVKFKRLGFVVTDEQHRFGVKQRGELISKGINPHTLVMSATPIPRTLALIIYGDLDISLLDEMPKGRIPVKTYGVDSSFRERLYKFIIKYADMGRQAYIVCPLIDEGVSEKAAASAYYEEIRENKLKGIPTGLLHGKMKQDEKDAVMNGFKNNIIKVLVSTTVIEVGVDVPNAVIMLIENAEQFGLSQLHQLRGRVGRGTEQSYCVLITDSKTAYTKSRIDIMKKTSNGFEIAGEDLKLRGPGDFFGRKQHGLPEIKIADMSEDVDLLKETGELAKTILKEDADLTLPENAAFKNFISTLFGNSEEYGFN